MFNGEINARVIRQLCGLAEKLDEQELFEFSRKSGFIMHCPV